MTMPGQQLSALNDPSLDRPMAMDAIDTHAQEVEKVDPSTVSDQAEKAGGAATRVNDLGDDLKLIRDDLQRDWDGVGADAAAVHLEKLNKASYKVSDKAEAAKDILHQVSEILDNVKKKVLRLAKEAHDDSAANGELIAAARQRMNGSDDESEIEAAAADIQRLRQLNERAAGDKKEEIEQALDSAEKQIDALLKPLGKEIEGGFVEIAPAGNGMTTASSMSTAPVDTSGGQPPALGGAGGPGGAGAGGGGGGGGIAMGVPPGSGSPIAMNVTADSPAAIAESLMGQTAADLMVSDNVLPMDSVPADVACANFVSAVLQKAGWIDWHTNTVAELQAKLLAEGWTSVPVSQAPPGSVVIANGGQHTVLVGDGDPPFIGSNNNLPNGNQSISAGGQSGMVMVLAPPPELLEGSVAN